MQRRHLLLAGLLAPVLAKASATTTLTAAAFPSVDAILRAARPEWNRRRPDVALEVVPREPDDHHTAMVTAIATSSHLPDVMAIEPRFLGRFVASGAFEDLSRPPYNAFDHRAHWVPFALAQAGTATGGLAAVPADVAPGSLFYRNDVLARSGIAAADLTRSWESFVASGARIRAATGAHLIAHAQELKDVIIRCGLGPTEGVYFDRGARVLIDTPRFHRAFALARQARAAGLDARLAPWSSERSEALRRGTVATQMMGSWFAGHLSNWLAPTTSGLWRCAPLPDGARCAWGGTFYAIPRRAPHKELAFELIRLMTLDRDTQLAAFKLQNSFPALLDTYQDSFFEQPIPFLGGQQARLLWRDAAVAIPPFLVQKLDPIAAEIVDSALDEVLIEGRDIPTALGHTGLRRNRP